jgi:predicted GIY-YIG superfamily endonuclease
MMLQERRMSSANILRKVLAIRFTSLIICQRIVLFVIDNLRIHSVYKYTSPVNKSYIGLTNDLKRRHQQHSIANGSTPYFHKAIKKYGGIESFTKEILETNMTRQEACIREIHYIKEFGTFGGGYNLTPGGDGCGSGIDNHKAISVKLYDNSTGEVLIFDCQTAAANYLDVGKTRICAVSSEGYPEKQAWSSKHNSWFQIKRQDDMTDWITDLFPNKNKPIIVIDLDTKIEISFSSVSSAAEHFGIQSDKIRAVINHDISKQFYDSKDEHRYDVQYKKSTLRPWSFDIPPKQHAVIAFDQDDNDDDPVYIFDSSAHAERELGIFQNHIRNSAQHKTWHAGKSRNKLLRWEYKNIEKRKVQQKRPEKKHNNTSKTSIFYYLNDIKIPFRSIRYAATETRGEWGFGTQWRYIQNSINSPDDAKLKCKAGFEWYIDM